MREKKTHCIRGHSREGNLSGYHCKTCKSENARKAREKKCPKPPKAPEGHKICGTKTCGQCKLQEEFNKDKTQKDGLSRICKECQSLATQRYAERNPDKIVDNQRKQNRKYRPRKNALRKQWAMDNPEKALFDGIKGRAKKKKVFFDLCLEDIIIPEHCPILGTKLIRRGTGKNRWNCPSVDRIIPELGYVRSNVAVISYRANMLKSNGTAEEHDRIAAWMREQTKEKQDGL